LMKQKKGAENAGSKEKHQESPQRESLLMRTLGRGKGRTHKRDLLAISPKVLSHTRGRGVCKKAGSKV